MYAPTSPYSQLETSRTILRQYAPTDEGEFLNLWGDPVVQRLSFVEDLSPARTAHFLQSTIQATANGSIFFLVVEDKERHEFLGHISLNFKPPPDRDATVGIALKARYRGRGFGTELMHWLITYAFRELGLRRISLTVVEDNIPALRMYKKMWVLAQSMMGALTTRRVAVSSMRDGEGMWASAMANQEILSAWA
jgi:RimJ/RimL family protein N-acetyltransferase